MPRGMVATFTLVLGLVACVGRTDEAEPAAPSAAQPPVDREYWPTDGWRTADPADHGFDSAELAEVDRLVEQSFTSVRSLLLVRDGHLVHERYWQGFDAEDGHDVRSVTKSVIGALVGIALDDGAIESLDATVGELLPGKVPETADPRMAGVTVRHLLSMTSGLPADDPTLGGDERVFEPVEQSPDWIRSILGLPLEADPGTRFAYSSLTSDLLSALVTDVTGRSTLGFARDRLFGPLGIDTSGAHTPVVDGPPSDEEIEEYERAAVAWPTDPQGYHFGGGGLKLPARDLAKIGFLYLDQGRWEDEQILPPGYVRDSTTPESATPDGAADYGWHWWVPRERDHGSFFARGMGGQLVYVAPGLDLVAVVTCDPGTFRGDTTDLVEQAVLPAAED